MPDFIFILYLEYGSIRLRDKIKLFYSKISIQILPYEPRVFPLSEEVYDKMLEVMPDGHWQASSTSLCPRDGDKGDDVRALYLY